MHADDATFSYSYAQSRQHMVPILSQSHAIGYKACQSLYYAVMQADRIELPLNTHATINFALTGCDPRKAVAAFQRLRGNRHQKWAARLGQGLAHCPTSFYVFENARDGRPFLTMEPGDPHNVHVHWVLHVPRRARHDFEQELHRWVAAVTGGIHDVNAIKVTYPEDTADAERLSRYLRKGAAELWADMFGASPKAQGLIVGGRRTGTTQNIARKARQAADRLEGINRKANLRAKLAKQKYERQQISG